MAQYDFLELVPPEFTPKSDQVRRDEYRRRDTEPMQEQLFQEMRGRVAEDDASVPKPDGPWDYLSAFRTGGQYPRFVRRPRGAAETGDQVYFDGDAEAAGKPYFRIGGISHSHDHAHGHGHSH